MEGAHWDCLPAIRELRELAASSAGQSGGSASTITRPASQWAWHSGSGEAAAGSERGRDALCDSGLESGKRDICHTRVPRGWAAKPLAAHYRF